VLSQQQVRGQAPATDEPCIVVEGGHRLTGTVPISGSKNAALALLAGTVLASEGVTVLHNLPCISDIETMAQILQHLGVDLTFQDHGHSAVIDATRLRGFEAPDQLVARMRGSLHLLGPVLARLGRVRLAQPGGCNIGARPIDLHLKGLTALGASLDTSHGMLFGEAPAAGLRGSSIYLDFPSVGATMNLLMAAALADGVTVIENAAQEPDVEDLANLIVCMGGKITRPEPGMIRVEGVKTLHGCEYTVSPDRIEAGTFALAAAITGGDIVLQGANASHLRPILLKIAEMGMKVEEGLDGVRVTHPGIALLPTDIVAMPHPGIPTDLQQPFAAVLALTEGTSTVTDKVYEGRFRYLTEMARMGVRARGEGRTAIITGVAALTGADVEATDLRAGAALVVAALAAEGTSRIFAVHHLERGYENLVEKLRGLGARIWREGGTSGRVPALASEGGRPWPSV
jgi:UDP-N-acetylglucosamine 1-carboxyvinyltransferase